MKLFRKSDELSTPRRRTESRRPEASSESEQPRRSTFRRGQTLTGSTSSSIASSGEYSAIIMSPRAHVHHLAKTRRSLGLRLVMIIVGALCIYLFVSQLVAHVSVGVAGASVTSNLANSYALRADDYLSNHPAERFYPILNQSNLTTYLQQQYPEIKSARLQLGGEFGAAELTVTLRQPVVRWSINGMNEFVDANGIVFTYNAFSTPGIEVVDKNGMTNAPEGVVTSRRFLSFVGTVVGDMKQHGFTVTQATIPALTTRQLEISISNVPYIARLTVDRSAGEQTEDIARIIPFLAARSLTPEYIDVRVQGKAFYK